MPRVTIKLNDGKSIRKIAVDSSTEWTRVRQQLAQMLGSNTFTVQYVDEDGDTIVLDSQPEWEALVASTSTVKFDLVGLDPVDKIAVQLEETHLQGSLYPPVPDQVAPTEPKEIPMIEVPPTQQDIPSSEQASKATVLEGPSTESSEAPQDVFARLITLVQQFQHVFAAHPELMEQVNDFAMHIVSQTQPVNVNLEIVTRQLEEWSRRMSSGPRRCPGSWQGNWHGRWQEFANSERFQQMVQPWIERAQQFAQGLETHFEEMRRQHESTETSQTTPQTTPQANQTSQQVDPTQLEQTLREMGISGYSREELDDLIRRYGNADRIAEVLLRSH